MAEDDLKATPAHGAATTGHEGCLRTLHELGAGASLSAEDANKATPAHDAAGFGHEGCLRALHELGASASLSAEDADKATPAHLAAGSGHEGCLQVLHECLSATIDPLIGELSKFRSTFTATINELEAMKALTDRNLDLQSPAHTAAAAGHTWCVEFLSKIGATSALLQDLQDEPELIEDEYECLLSNPRLLDLPTKQAWLSWSLENQVGEADEEQLELISRRDNMLEGLCAMLGVDESSGQLLSGADARSSGRFVVLSSEAMVVASSDESIVDSQVASLRPGNSFGWHRGDDGAGFQVETSMCESLDAGLAGDLPGSVSPCPAENCPASTLR